MLDGSLCALEYIDVRDLQVATAWLAPDVSNLGLALRSNTANDCKRLTVLVH